MEPAGAAVLRAPAIDPNDQIGASLLVQYHGPIPPSDPEPPTGFPWQTIENAVRGVYEKIGMGVHSASGKLTDVDGALRQRLGWGAQAVEDVTGISTLLDLRTAWRFVERELDEHPAVAAGLATALDVVGVVGGIIGVVVLLPEIATVAGAAAIIGAGTAALASAALVRADGPDAYLLITEGDQAGVPPDQTPSGKWEHSDYFRRTELLAPLMVLPDAVRSGIGVVREVGEASEAARAAASSRSEAILEDSQAATKIAAQQAANAAKPKLYKGDRQKLQKLVVSEKNAAKKLRRANTMLKNKQDALRATMLKSLKRDGAGLLSAAGGTGFYAVHSVPDMLQTPADKMAPQQSTGP